MGIFAMVAENAATIVALPSIAETFRTDLSTTQWVLIGYFLTISAVLLPAGRLADIVGLKPVYLIGLPLFVLGLLAVGAAPNHSFMILARVVQGIGSAMALGSSMAILVSAFPSSERGRVLGVYMAVVGIGAVVGPIFGGTMIGLLGWRWMFYAIALLSGLAIVAAAVILKRDDVLGAATKGRFDWVGVILSAVALTAFLLGLTNGPLLGWGSLLIIMAFAICVVVMLVFIWWERRTLSPMLDMAFFSRRLFSLGVLASFVEFIGLSSARFLIPFYLQFVLGHSPAQIGFIVVPGAASMTIMALISGSLSDRYGWRIFNVGGLLLTAAGLLVLATLQTHSTSWVVMVGLILAVGGNGMFYPTNNSSILSTVEKTSYGIASGFLHLVRNVGNMTGLAVATAIVTAVMASAGFSSSLAVLADATQPELTYAFVAGLRLTYLTMGSFLLVGVLASLLKGNSTIQVGRETKN